MHRLSMRAIFAAMLTAFVASACRSATDASATEPSIVFFEGDQEGQLVLISPDGSVRRPLLDMPAGHAMYPRWSPDGRQIVFFRVFGGYGRPTTTDSLSIINADGSGLRQIHASIGGLGSADWSPDGARVVAYWANRLVVLGTDGSGLTTLPPTNAHVFDWYRGLSWSPDGNEILYDGTQDIGGAAVGPDIWVFNLTTGVARMLANPGLDARWSPDGRRIAYVSAVFSGYPGKIVVMDSDGSNARAVTIETQTFPDFTWSPDGQRILFVGGCCDRTDLYSIPVAGGRATNLTNNEANHYVHYPDWYRPR